MCVIPSSRLYGKDGKVKYGTTFYKGEVENKVPKGQGTLFVKEGEEIIMFGLFNDKHVSNATLKCIDFEFTGELDFEPGLDKKSEIGKFHLLSGELRFNSHSQQYKLLKPVSFIWVKKSICIYSDINWILKSSLGSDDYYLHYRENNFPNYSKYDERNIDSVYFANGDKAYPLNSGKWKFTDNDGSYLICRDFNRNHIIKVHKHVISSQCTIDAEKLDDTKYRGDIKYANGNSFKGEFVLLHDGTISLKNGNMMADGYTDLWMNGVNVSLAQREAAKKAEISVALLKSKLEADGTVVYTFRGTGTRNDNTHELANLGLEPEDLFYDCTLVLKKDGTGNFESYWSPSDKVEGKQTIHYKRNGGAVRHPEYVKEFCQSAIGVKSTGAWRIIDNKLELGKSSFTFVDDGLVWHSIEDCQLKIVE